MLDGGARYCLFADTSEAVGEAWVDVIIVLRHQAPKTGHEWPHSQ